MQMPLTDPAGAIPRWANASAMDISEWRVRVVLIRCPVVCGRRPVTSIARAGVHTGQLEIALVRVTPADHGTPD